MTSKTDLDQLTELFRVLDAPQNRFTQLDAYFQGNSPLSYLSADAKAALANFDRFSSNLCRTAVVSLSERLRIASFDGVDVWDEFTRSNLDQLSATAHRDALLYGNTYVLVWTDKYGNPRATIESPKTVAVQRDPVTREVVSAVKRISTKTTTEAWIYLPGEVQHWRSDTPASAAGGFRKVDVTPHDLGAVPVVPLGLEDEPSVIADLVPIQDALSKLILDALIAWSTRDDLVGRRSVSSWWKRLGSMGTGIRFFGDDGEPVMDAVNPFPEQNRMMVSENEKAVISQLPAADLSGFESGVRILISQAMMVSGLPAHYVGALQDSVTSADALRAAEAALVSRAEAKQQAYGLGWESVARLLVAIRDGVDPYALTARIVWSPADTRSQAQEADAVVKLVQAGILPVSYALSKLGYSQDEVLQIRAARRAEALDSAAVDLTAIPRAVA